MGLAVTCAHALERAQGVRLVERRTVERVGTPHLAKAQVAEVGVELRPVLSVRSRGHR